ncbi:hypothetical protein CIJ84_12310 [Neisseria meningitidis]|uniref:Uncharacterized protein n=1 Tax=Neisseria meningitidis TaxID=487 RepID=A0AB37K575_NEIME|nr:hypothetical protein CIJ84_12310 [Neisseria meningitidis]RNJ89961.1 hypothetical protein COI31_12505 [Neisseria meningitidis]CWT47023.1 fimbrial protein MS11-D1 precursor [Neisseria meningitidis]
MFGNHGLGGLLKEGAHGKSPKCLGGNLGDFGEFCKGLGLYACRYFSKLRHKKPRRQLPSDGIGARLQHTGRQSLRQTTGTIRASDGFAVYGRGTIPAAIELANIASDKPHAQKNE